MGVNDDGREIMRLPPIDIRDNTYSVLVKICEGKGISLEEGIKNALERYIDVWELGTNILPRWDKKGNKILYGGGIPGDF